MADYNTPFPYSARDIALAVTYKNGKLIAEDVIPVRGPSLKLKSAMYWEFDFGQMIQLGGLDTRVGRRGRVKTIEVNAKRVPFMVYDYGLGAEVPQEDIDQAGEARMGAPAYDPLRHHILALTDILLLEREKRVADLFMSAGTYNPAQVYAVGAGNKFDDPAANPIKFVRDRLRNMIMRPDSCAMSYNTLEMLQMCPAFLQAYHGEGSINKGMVPVEFIQQQWGISKIHAGEAWINTARPGQATTTQRAWQDGTISFFVNNQMADPITSDTTATFAFTAEYGTRVAGRKFNPDIGLRGGVEVKSGWSINEIICGKDLGALFTGIFL
jgi:hypothetical protein